MEQFSFDSFEISNAPKYRCPSCALGILYLKDKMTLEEMADTKHQHDHPEYGHEWVTYSFNAKLECNDKDCQEIVFMIGKATPEEVYLDEPTQYQHQIVTYCFPKYFHPHLNIFDIIETVPEPVKNMIEKSFELFFSDLDSCGNRIRAAIEVLLDELGIPRDDLSKKIDFIPLARRINKLPPIHSKIKDYLTAIKWLGNIGTHGQDSLTRNNILMAYEVIEHVLDELYKVDKDKAHIVKFITDINATRGKNLG